MNKRIAKLYDQAIVVEDCGDYVTGELDPAKFAELIIKECVQTFKDSHKYGSPYAKEVIQDAARHVKKHFGVR